jgi:hypothetical protein
MNRFVYLRGADDRNIVVFGREGPGAGHALP